MCNSENIFYSKFEVYTLDVDMFKNVKPSALFAFMVETAFKHAKSYGKNYETDQSDNIWVLSSIEIEIYKQIIWQDIIEIKTWPRLQQGIYFYRDFEIISTTGETLAVATSSWLFINKKHRLPDRKIIKESNINCFDFNILGRNPQKLLPAQNIKKVDIVKVSFNNFDFHKHVNNSVYVDWIFNTYEIEFLEKNTLLSIQFDFIYEITNTDEVDIFRAQKDNIHLFEGYNSITKGICFRASVKWQ